MQCGKCSRPDGAGEIECTPCIRPLPERSLVCALSLASTSPAHAQAIETEHLFGYTIGSDVGNVGERNSRARSTGRFSKADTEPKWGSGTVSRTCAHREFRPIPRRQLDIAGVNACLTFRRGFSADFRYRLLDRATAPFGLAIGAEPHWGRADDHRRTRQPMASILSRRPIGKSFATASSQPSSFTSPTPAFEPDRTRSQESSGRGARRDGADPPLAFLSAEKHVTAERRPVAAPATASFHSRSTTPAANLRAPTWLKRLAMRRAFPSEALEKTERYRPSISDHSVPTVAATAPRYLAATCFLPVARRAGAAYAVVPVVHRSRR